MFWLTHSEPITSGYRSRACEVSHGDRLRLHRTHSFELGPLCVRALREARERRVGRGGGNEERIGDRQVRGAIAECIDHRDGHQALAFEVRDLHIEGIHLDPSANDVVMSADTRPVPSERRLRDRRREAATRPVDLATLGVERQHVERALRLEAEIELADVDVGAGCVPLAFDRRAHERQLAGPRKHLRGLVPDHRHLGLVGLRDAVDHHCNLRIRVDASCACLAAECITPQRAGAHRGVAFDDLGDEGVHRRRRGRILSRNRDRRDHTRSKENRLQTRIARRSSSVRASSAGSSKRSFCGGSLGPTRNFRRVPHALRPPAGIARASCERRPESAVTASVTRGSDTPRSVRPQAWRASRIDGETTIARVQRLAAAIRGAFAPDDILQARGPHAPSAEPFGVRRCNRTAT